MNSNENKNAKGEDTYAGRFAPLAQAPPLAFLLLFWFEFAFNSNFEKRRVAVTSQKSR